MTSLYSINAHAHVSFSCLKSKPLAPPGGAKFHALHRAPQDGMSVAAGDEFNALLRDPIALRDSCRCPLCVDPSTKQRKFSTAHISPDIQAVPAEPGADGSLKVRWRNDIAGYSQDHVSVFSLEDLRSLRPKSQKVTGPKAPRTWDARTFKERALWIDHDQYLTSAESLRKALSDLYWDGLIFLTNVPEHRDSVVKIGERIGPLRNTFYGASWDVRSVPNSKNVAYTNDDLRFHMDLLYMKNPPGYQFLHFVSNDCEGGESQFADALYAAERLFESDRNAYDILCGYPMQWTYQNDGQFYRQTRPTFQEVALERPLDDEHQVLTPASKPRLDYVNWSPPFQGSLYHDAGHPEKTQELVRALQAYDRILNSDDMVLELKMKPRTCAIFENRRVVHARRAFTLGSGERFLRGTYVDEDAFWSRCRTLGIGRHEEMDRSAKL